MNIKKILLCCAIHITLSINALVITTGVPKSSATTLLATVLKELMQTNRSAAIKGDMELDEKQMQRNDLQCNELRRNELLIGTPVYNEHNVALVEKYNAQVVHIIRDPRDLITAMGQKIHTYRKLIAAARNKNRDQIISEIITGGAAFYAFLYAFDEVQNVKGVADLYAFWLPWIDHPNALTIRFEDLCGANGPQAQQQTIKTIAQFLNIACDAQRAQKIATKLQGGGLFGLFKKKPSVGKWKELFNTQHKTLCKQIAGQLIIDLGYAAHNNW